MGYRFRFQSETIRFSWDRYGTSKIPADMNPGSYPALFSFEIQIKIASDRVGVLISVKV